MNAIRLGGPFGLSVHGEKQLIGNIVLMDSSFFRKSGNEKTERGTDATVVDHKLLFGVGEAHDLRHRRVHDQVYTVKRIQRGPFVFDQIDCVRKPGRNLVRISFDPLKRPPLSILVVCTAPMHDRPQEGANLMIGIPLNGGL